MPSFIVWLRKNVRLYTEANRVAQLRSAIDSPGSDTRKHAKSVQRLRFRAFRLKKSMLDAGFSAIPFDFRLRLT